MDLAKDLSDTFHNLETMLTGHSTFAEFRDGEVAMFRKDVGELPEVVQGAANLLIGSLEAGASVLVGFGQTAIGPVLAETSDDQATQIANLLSLMGVKAAGPLSIAEHAVLVAALNALKAGIDRIGLKITVNGFRVVEKPAATQGVESTSATEAVGGGPLPAPVG